MNEKKRLAFTLAVIFAVNIIIIMLIQGMPGIAAPYRRSSTGAIVTPARQKLKNRGYMSAPTGQANGTEFLVRLIDEAHGDKE